MVVALVSVAEVAADSVVTFAAVCATLEASLADADEVEEEVARAVERVVAAALLTLAAVTAGSTAKLLSLSKAE